MKYIIKGELLDLKCCDEDFFLITSSINQNYSELDMNFLREEAEKGINILNSSEPIFINKCTSFDYNKKDIHFNERLKLFPYSINICGEQCTLKSVDYSLNETICECKTRTNGISEKLEERENITIIEGKKLHITFICSVVKKF